MERTVEWLDRMVRNPPPKQWSNSKFGRSLGTVLGLVWVGGGLSVLLAQDGSPQERVATGLGLVVVGVSLLVTFWTARLSVRDGCLVARNFYGSKSIPLAQIVHAEPAIIGLVFSAENGTRMRSLASGRAFDEFWKTRAERICDEVLRLAREARRIGSA